MWSIAKVSFFPGNAYFCKCTETVLLWKREPNSVKKLRRSSRTGPEKDMTKEKPSDFGWIYFIVSSEMDKEEDKGKTAVVVAEAEVSLAVEKVFQRIGKVVHDDDLLFLKVLKLLEEGGFLKAPFAPRS
jgi:hypothetical protein